MSFQADLPIYTLFERTYSIENAIQNLTRMKQKNKINLMHYTTRVNPVILRATVNFSYFNVAQFSRHS